MTEGSRSRQLVLEIERIQTIRRPVATLRIHYSDRGENVDFVNGPALARIFEVSVAEAVLQRRSRAVLCRISPDGIVACTASPLALCKSLPPASLDTRLPGS